MVFRNIIDNRVFTVSAGFVSCLVACLIAFDTSLASHANAIANAEREAISLVEDLGLAREVIVSNGLKEFSRKTQPHQAKELRKQIVRLRDIFDIYSYSFSHRMGLWSEIRKGLDEGYRVVGDYKDLFDTNFVAIDDLKNGRSPTYPDQKKLIERQKKVLEWKKFYFSERGLRLKVTELLGKVKELDDLDISNSKRFSKFFWGGVEVAPYPGVSPAETAKLLVEAQIQISMKEHPEVLDIIDPSTHENEILFHDHRKRLRTIAKVCHVANHFQTESCDSRALGEIEDLVSELGEIEDLIVTGRHLETDGRIVQAGAAYKKAVSKFQTLKHRFKDQNMLEALNRL